MADLRWKARAMLAQDQTILYELWLRYFANCGDADLFEFHAYLYGIHELRPMDLDVLTCAIDDMTSLTDGTTPYRRN